MRAIRPRPKSTDRPKRGAVRVVAPAHRPKALSAEGSALASPIWSLLSRGHSALPRRQKKATQVAQQIVADISRKGLTPGSMLPGEREMIAKYQVGRPTLRETLRYLELQGLIALKPGRGGGPSVMAPEPRYLANSLALGLEYTRTTFRTVLETRAVIEPIAAAEAAKNIDPTLLGELASSVTAMGDALEDVRLFLEQNERFHNIIAWSSGNPIFGYLLSALHRISDGSNMGITYSDETRRLVCRAHTAIYKAIAAGDADRARRAMSVHLEASISVAQSFPHLLDARVRWDHI